MIRRIKIQKGKAFTILSKQKEKYMVYIPSINGENDVDFLRAFCPRCGFVYSEQGEDWDRAKYCKMCGQKIKWALSYDNIRAHQKDDISEVLQ